MKAKTKRRVIHVLTKKKLVKRKTSKHVLRTFLILLATVSMGSLSYAITMTKPAIGVVVHSTGAGGVEIKAPAPIATPAPVAVTSGSTTSGRGSWYALGLPEPDALTCASRTFPRGTYLEVTDMYNGHTMICRVNDYGPEVWTGRIIDLSRGSFRQVDDLGRGTIPVQLRVVSSPTGLLRPPEGDVSLMVGYARCALDHTGDYCDIHRHD